MTRLRADLRGIYCVAWSSEDIIGRALSGEAFVVPGDEARYPCNVGKYEARYPCYVV